MIELANVRGDQMIFNMSVPTPEKKPTIFGKYAWKKYSIGEKFQQKTTTVKKEYVADPNPEFPVVYVADSITRDAVNGIYTLVSPNKWDLTPDAGGYSMGESSYVMFSVPSGRTVFKTDAYSVTKTVVRLSSTKGALIIPDNENAPFTKYSYEVTPVYTFEEYVVSDEETKYPANGDLEGFHYEQITS